MSANLPTGYDLLQIPTMGQDQRGIYDMLRSIMQGGQGGFDLMGKLAGGDISQFEQMEAPAMRQLQESILPGIAQRYGSQGVGQSSGFQQAATAAGTNLAEMLQGQRMGIQQQSLAQLLGLGKQLLGTPTEQFGIGEQQEGALAGLLASGGEALLKLLPTLLPLLL